MTVPTLRPLIGRSPAIPGETGRKSHWQFFGEIFSQARSSSSLRLADCEARLDRAHAHYAEVQGRDREPGLDEDADHLEDLLLFDWAADGAKWEAARRIVRLDHLSHHYAARRKRLASRYLREAQSRRDKALVEFLGHELPK